MELQRERQRQLSHVQDYDARQVLAKLIDKAEIVLRRKGSEITDFLDPYHLDLAKGILRSMELAVLEGGGYPRAERRRLVLANSIQQVTEADLNISVLHLKGDADCTGLSHRDYLGSLLGLGLRREKVGDIVVQPDQAWVILDSSLSGFVRQNLLRVSRVPVRVEEVSSDLVETPAASQREIRTTVPSLRLDAVAGEGYGLSRSKMAAEIAGGKVKVNWRPVTQSSLALGVGDVISCRGLGRVVLAEVRGSTKKGRIAILLQRLK